MLEKKIAVYICLDININDKNACNVIKENKKIIDYQISENNITGEKKYYIDYTGGYGFNTPELIKLKKDIISNKFDVVFMNKFTYGVLNCLHNSQFIRAIGKNKTRLFIVGKEKTLFAVNSAANIYNQRENVK